METLKSIITYDTKLLIYEQFDRRYYYSRYDITKIASTDKTPYLQSHRLGGGNLGDTYFRNGYAIRSPMITKFFKLHNLKFMGIDNNLKYQYSNGKIGDSGIMHLTFKFE